MRYSFSSTDYYERLEVVQSSSQDTIKKAYRKLAKVYHPDLSDKKDDELNESKLKSINEAYEVLGDPVARKEYDSFLTYRKSKSSTSNTSVNSSRTKDTYNTYSRTSVNVNGFDINFNTSYYGSSGSKVNRETSSNKAKYNSEYFDFFKSSNTTTPRNNTTIPTVTVELTSEEAYKGCVKELKLPIVQPCPKCFGLGRVTNSFTNRTICSACNGIGKVRAYNNEAFNCRRCNGTGYENTILCDECNGNRYKNIYKNTKVSIPGGARSGTRLSTTLSYNSVRYAVDIIVIVNNINNKSNSNNSRPSSASPKDSYYKDNSRFQWSSSRASGVSEFELDTHSSVLLSYEQFILGDNIYINLNGSNIKVVIPNNTNPNTILRLKGRGKVNPSNKNLRGHHYLTLKLELPDSISEQEKELLEKIKSLR